MPEAVKKMVIQENEAAIKECQIAFSAMPADQAKDVEPALAAAGMAVVSNASSHRMDVDVPICLPEINPDHTALVEIHVRTRIEKALSSPIQIAQALG